MVIMFVQPLDDPDMRQSAGCAATQYEGNCLPIAHRFGFRSNILTSYDTDRDRSNGMNRTGSTDRVSRAQGSLESTVKSTGSDLHISLLCRKFSPN